MSLASLSFSPARQHHLRIHKLVCVGESNTAMSTLFRASIVVTPIGGDYGVLTNARRSPYVGNLDFSITTVLLLAFSFVFGLSFCAKITE